ncbi:MAG: glycosyltransferase family 39 protein [Aggregatilineales bacterium]
MQDVMQDVMNYPANRISDRSAGTALTFSVELIAYLVIFGFALALRLAELDAVPLGVDEAQRALAAWRVAMPGVVGAPIVPDSPLIFAIQTISFMLMGGSEQSARLVIALAGALLVIAPALFRAQFGPSRALLFSFVLLFSPVLLVASRTSSPVIVSLALGTVLLWAFSRYQRRRARGDAILVTALAAALMLLAGPDGPVLALILALAWVTAHRLTAREDPYAFDEPPTQFETGSPQQRESLLTTWPWLLALPVAALVVVVVATLFMLYPPGLSAVGALIVGTLSAVGVSAPTAFHPVLAALFYEPFVIAAGLIAYVLMARRGSLVFVDRFLLGWAAFGALAGLFFTESPAYASWITVPMAGLAARLGLLMISHDQKTTDWPVPYWARYVVALAAAAIFAVLTMGLQQLARNLLFSLDGTLTSAPIDLTSAILVFVTTLFAIVTYFMAVSVWDRRTALQGIGIGVLVLGLLTSLGAGWNVAVVRAASPTEFWRTRATSMDMMLLRDTLFELARRETRGFPSLPIAVLAPQDGVIAWVVRDFTGVRFITEPSAAYGEGVVLFDAPILPELGGSYVGQDFAIERSWSLSALRPIDLFAWWTQGRVRADAKAEIRADMAYLWLRQDIYDGVQPDINPRG